MAVPDNLSEILERVRTRTSTVEDLEFLRQALSYPMLQTVSQSGKYNTNASQGNFYIGDRYGPSVDDIRAIVQALQTLQGKEAHKSLKQPEKLSEEELLSALVIEPQLIELINSRLTALEELHQAGYLSNIQEAELSLFKGKIRSLTEMNCELKVLANDANQMLCEAIAALEGRLQDLDISQIKDLRIARSKACLQQQIEMFRRFQTELEDGKIVVCWLDEQRSQNIAQVLGQSALDAFSDIKETASSRQVEAFYFSIDQFLERLSHCLTWGRNNILLNPTTPIVLADELYIAAFEELKSFIPGHLPNSGISQLREHIDYLIERLPNYQHVSIE
ncbi:hypothetical protein [Sphaerothrix gracilis]|uniref:hypothetical protein n=1 Tax=Sphaerothrix gracilis TaxID=3151835 RepID=UPI0031FDDEC5